MGRRIVKVPDVGEGVAEVEIVAWLVGPGDLVERSQIVAEVLTDKANVEVPSPTKGTVFAVHGGVGSTLAVGSPLLELDVEGVADDPIEEPANDQSSSASNSTPETTATPYVVVESPSEPIQPSAADSPAQPVARQAKTRPRAVGSKAHQLRPEGERPRAAPSVRARARDGGIDLRRLVGTGPAGRITHDDLDQWWHDNQAASAAGTGFRSPRRPDTSTLDEPIIGIRRRIAENMVQAVQSIPHITYVEEIDVTNLEQLRDSLNAADASDSEATPRLTILPFLIRAVVVAVGAHPQINAHMLDSENVLRRFGGVHVGVATQTDAGLMVPVLRHAETEGLWGLAARIGQLASGARDGTLSRGDLTGSTITVSSLGALGGIVSTPVINKPEVAVVGVNKITVRPVWVNGEFVPRKMMNLSSSFDHRVIDGWDAATFVQELKRLLEQPALLFIEQPAGDKS